jgi:DNA-binding LacI/PurR family transcriptional regulator
MLDIERLRNAISGTAPAPLHARLRSAVNDQIADGTLKPGETLPSERYIHEMLNLSRSTVRQAVRSLTDMGLIQSVPGAGNFVLERPDSASRSQPSSSSKLIGVLADGSSFYLYYAQLASSFNHVLRNAGYHVDLALHNNDPDHFEELVDSFIRVGATAIAINPSTWFDIKPAIEKFRAAGIRVVLIGRRIDSPDTDYVGTNNQLLGYQATQHLLELGHTQIIHIGTPNYSTAQDRAIGYIQAMQEAGLAPRIFRRPIEPYMQDRSIPENLAEFMEPNIDPAQVWMEIVRQEITAAFCFNDETAIWVQKGLRNLNLEVPKDMSLVAVDNLPFVFDAPLTTFILPGEQVGKQAAEVLLERLRGESFPAQQLALPAQFIQRLSTAPPKRKLERQ